MGYGPRVTRAVGYVMVVLGLIPAAVAFAAVVGLGVARAAPTLVLAGAAVGMIGVPVAGLWSLFGRGPAAGIVALWAWNLGLLVGLPAFFPGEVPGAVANGFGALAALGGRDAAATAARAGSVLAQPVAHAPVGRPPLAEAERAPPECPPAPVDLGSVDQVALPYEGQGHSLVIPVQFEDAELDMLFDTGATYTTLDRRSLARLGVKVPADAPEIEVRTANGPRTARLVLVPRLWVGGLLVEGVTVGVCDECADERTVGLLGLNVSGQFLVTVDTARKEVIFQVRPGAVDRVVDVSPWLDLKSTARLWADGRTEVEVDARNRADRPVREARVGIHCGDEHYVVRLANLAAGERRVQTSALPRDADCPSYRVTLDSARW